MIVFGHKSASCEPYLQRNRPVIMTVSHVELLHGHLVIHVGHCDSYIGSLGQDCDEGAETIVFGQKSAID